MKTALINSISDLAKSIHGKTAVAYRGLTTFTQSGDCELHFGVDASANSWHWTITIEGGRPQLVVKTADIGSPTTKLEIGQTPEIQQLLEVSREYINSLL